MEFLVELQSIFLSPRIEYNARAIMEASLFFCARARAPSWKLHYSPWTMAVRHTANTIYWLLMEAVVLSTKTKNVSKFCKKKALFESIGQGTLQDPTSPWVPGRPSGDAWQQFSNGERRVGDNVWFSAKASSKASKTSSLLAKHEQILVEHSNCLAAPMPPLPPAG